MAEKNELTVEALIMISIIVPIYNASKTLERCLSSLAEQTFKDIEVIMINDGSMDNSAEICHDFSQKDARFKYIYQKNSGVSAARNAGLKCATGEYIGFCDADDWADADMYEMLYNNLLENHADVSICSCYIDYPDKKDNDVNTDTQMYVFNRKEAIKEMHIGKKFAGQPWNKLLKKELVADLEFPSDITIFEDMVFFWDIFNKSDRIVFQNTKKYHYIQFPNSAMHKFKESFWTVQKACNLMLNNMQIFFPDMLVYAQKTVIMGNMELAHNLYGTKKLNNTNYKKIFEKVKACYNENSIAHFSKNQAIQIKLFLNSRILYIVAKNFQKAKRGIESWIKTKV